MCLVVLAVRPAPTLDLVVAANRDELHARPSRELHAWDGRDGVIAGRDLRASGTWLGVTSRGRFAAVTNVRSPTARRTGESRGALVRAFLESDAPTVGWCSELGARTSEYPAFNLIVSDGTEVRYANDEAPEGVVLEAGLHGLSNARLDTAWPKVANARAALGAAIAGGELDVEAMFAALASETRAPDASLPSTGVPLEIERALSSAFIRGAVYGTRCSTVVVRRSDGSGFIEERRFDEAGVESGRTRLAIDP